MRRVGKEMREKNVGFGFVWFFLLIFIFNVIGTYCWVFEQR